MDTIKNPIIKNILSAIAIALLGFVLLNLIFILDFLFVTAVTKIINLFTPTDLAMTYSWYPPVMQGLFIIIIGLVSWLVFRSKLGTCLKAAYLTIPTAVILATIGIFLYRWPVVSYSLGGLITIGALYYFYCTKKPWLYWYAVILVSITLLIMGITGTEI